MNKEKIVFDDEINGKPLVALIGLVSDSMYFAMVDKTEEHSVNRTEVVSDHFIFDYSDDTLLGFESITILRKMTFDDLRALKEKLDEHELDNEYIEKIIFLIIGNSEYKSHLEDEIREGFQETEEY